MNDVSRLLRALLAICAVFALLPPAPAGAARGAQSAGLTLEAAPGYGGYYRPNEPTPIRVTVANEGPDLDVRLEVERAGTLSDASSDAVYVRPVSLPTHSRKVETLYIPGPARLTGTRVRLMQGSTVLAETELQATAADRDDLLVGVVSSAAGTLDFLAGVHSSGTSTRVAALSLADLPAQDAGWDSLDLLIIDDVASDALSSTQVAALKAWVERGGHLVVTGGPGWQATASGLEALLPARATGTRNLESLAALSALSAAPLAPGPYVAAEVAAAPDAEVVLAEGDTPLVVRRATGQGLVTYLALSTTLAPLDAWSGNAEFWRETVLRNNVRRTALSAGVLHFGTAADALVNLPSLRLPSATDLMCLLGLYIVIIGPVNYVVLRRLKRFELAWLTIPALVLLFTAVTYVAGTSYRGTRPTLHRLAVVRARAGDAMARGDLLVGLYSPQRRDYELRWPGRVAVRTLHPQADAGLGATTVVMEGDDATVVQAVRVDIAGMRQFSARASVPGPGIVADLTITTGSGGTPRVMGRLANTGRLQLQNAVLLYGLASASVGDIAPGAELAIDKTLRSGGTASGPSTLFTILGVPPYGGSRDSQRRWQLAWSALSDTGAYGTLRSMGRDLYLLAWAESFPGAVEVPGGAETSDLSLYLIQLSDPAETNPSGLGPGGGRVLASDADMSYTVTEQSGFVLQADVYGLELGDGAYASFLFTPERPYDVTRVMTLTYALDTPDRTSPLPAVVLWNWSQQRWDPAGPKTWARAHPSPNPARAYVNSDGEVMLRIAAPASVKVFLSDFNLSVETAP